MADGQQSRAHRVLSIGEKSRRWFVAIGTVAAIAATTIGFLSDSVGVWQFLKNYEATATPIDTLPSNIALAAVITDTVIVTATSLPTATPSLTATPLITPTNTPIPVAAAPNERLLLVAQFSNFATDASYNVAGRIDDALSDQVTAAQLADTRVAEWPNTIGDLTAPRPCYKRQRHHC